MADELVIVPSREQGYVSLARSRSGRLFKKHILSKGELIHPVTGRVISIDDQFIDTMTRNFNTGVCPIVQVPLAGPNNEHTEAPDRNIGEVIGLETTGDKVYAVIDARDNDAAEKLGKTFLGASAMFSLDYTDTKTGSKVGPTLLHTCVTNRPYLTDLDDYEEIVAATSDTSERAVVLLSAPQTEGVEDQAHQPEETQPMPDTEKTPAKPSLDELLTALRTDHGIDVSALQAQAADSDQATKLSHALVEALTTAGVVKLTNTDGPSTEDVVGAVAELAERNVALSNQVGTLVRKDAENEVNTLVQAGRVMPAQRNAFVELKLTNQTMFDQLVPAEPIIKLTQETGVNPAHDASHDRDIDAEVARLTKLLPTNGRSK